MSSMIKKLKVLSHYVIGAGLGVASVRPGYQSIAVPGMLLVIAYQGLEWAKWRDTPAHDLKQYGWGYVLGLIGGICANRKAE